MKYLEALLTRKAEGSLRPAAPVVSRRAGADITAKSPGSSPEHPSGGFVSPGAEHLACNWPAPPPPEWPRIEADLGPGDAFGERIEAFEERAAIMEFDGGLPRDEAERRADSELADYFKPTGLLA